MWEDRGMYNEGGRTRSTRRAQGIIVLGPRDPARVSSFRNYLSFGLKIAPQGATDVPARLGAKPGCPRSLARLLARSFACLLDVRDVDVEDVGDVGGGCGG